MRSIKLSLVLAVLLSSMGCAVQVTPSGSNPDTSPGTDDTSEYFVPADSCTDDCPKRDSSGHCGPVMDEDFHLLGWLCEAPKPINMGDDWEGTGGPGTSPGNPGPVPPVPSPFAGE